VVQLILRDCKTICKKRNKKKGGFKCKFISAIITFIVLNNTLMEDYFEITFKDADVLYSATVFPDYDSDATYFQVHYKHEGVDSKTIYLGRGIEMEWKQLPGVGDYHKVPQELIKTIGEVIDDYNETVLVNT
jgi:hypothetical protein